MKIAFFIVCAGAAFAASLHADPRSSASYSVPSESIDSGGGPVGSANYSARTSLGSLTAEGSASASYAAKSGLPGSQPSVTNLAVNASPLTVNEGQTLQLAASLLLDDNTTTALASTAPAWSVQSGPIASISAGGLVTADVVYQNTAAQAKGSYLGFESTLGLSVLDVNKDNFGSYAADGVGDDWQVQYFGLNNLNAGPLADPDYDGHSNLFEFTAGLLPNDANSKFGFRIETVPGQPEQKRVVFSPRLIDRQYTVKYSATLGASATWLPLTGGSTQDSGSERTVTDPNTAAGTRFYTVEINKP